MLRKSLLVALLALVSISQAAVVYNEWSGGAGTSDWNTATNWKLGYVPFIFNGTNQIKAGFKVGGTISIWPVITESTSPIPQADQITLGGISGGFLTINSGTLNIGEYITIGANTGENGIFYVNGGSINTGVGYTNSHLFIGQKGTGTLYMNGGTINLPSSGNLRIADQSGSSGKLYLNAGTIYANDLLMPFAAAGSIDITGGSLVLNGNDTAAVNAFISAGKIVTSLENGVIQVSFDAGTNKTTLSAIPEPATLCLLGLGAFGFFGRKK
jgi:hypothetical protein